MLILNLQFWPGDKERMMGLVRLICDLEPEFRNDVFIHFFARFDATHDRATMEYAARKFRVTASTGRRRATGWPNGPNQMMGESYEYLVEMSRRNKYPGAKGVLFMESDCVPLHKNWLNMLIDEYAQCGKMCLGAWLKKGDANVEHINGNMVMGLGFWRKCPQVFHPESRGGWDATLRRWILPNGAPSRLIWSDYQLGMPHNPLTSCEFLWEKKYYKSPDNPLFGQEITPVYFHGIKTEDGLICARKRLL